MNKNPIPCSVLIIGQNSEKFLKRCLDSLTNFAEVIFIDGGSVDKTEAIAKSYSNVKFIFNKWPGFIPQRNFSIEQATLDWCFMIDSDEAITPELEDEIRKIVLENDQSIIMYRVCRTEYIEGVAIESGLGRSDYQERLFQRKRTQYTGGNHHEHLIDGINTNLLEAQSKIKNLPFHIRVLHDPTYRLEDMIMKLPRFSLLIGKEKYAKGRRVTVFGIVFTFVWTTIRFSVLSWRMGRRGVVQAMMKAYSDSLAKLYIYTLEHLRENKKNDIDQKNLG